MWRKLDDGLIHSLSHGSRHNRISHLERSLRALAWVDAKSGSKTSGPTCCFCCMQGNRCAGSLGANALALHDIVGSWDCTRGERCNR